MGFEEIPETIQRDQAGALLLGHNKLAVVGERVSVLGDGHDRIGDLGSHFELLRTMLMSRGKTAIASAEVRKFSYVLYCEVLSLERMYRV